MSLGFGQYPTAFALYINDICLLSISGVAIAGSALGLPMQGSLAWDDEVERIGLELLSGRGVLAHSDLVKHIPSGGSVFAQPIFSEQLGMPEMAHLYDTDLCRQLSLDWSSGTGHILKWKPSSLEVLQPEQCTMATSGRVLDYGGLGYDIEHELIGLQKNAVQSILESDAPFPDSIIERYVNTLETMHTWEEYSLSLKKLGQEAAVPGGTNFPLPRWEGVLFPYIPINVLQKEGASVFSVD